MSDSENLGPAGTADGMPTRLGRYEIEGRLGEGAMGEVFLARDPQIERRLALKTVKVRATPGTQHDNLRERLLMEAKAAGQLVHPNVVTLFDAGEDEGTVFLAFEYVEGQHLGERVEGGDPLTVAEVLRLVREVASALAAAQARGIVHRDIKPSNILLDTAGTAKIADFGIAKMHDSTSDLTVTGAIIGTPHYMSPEQIRAEKLDGRSDVFSLGALLYELVHRSRPFRGDTITTLVYQILHHDPLEKLRSDLPSELADLMRGMLAKELDDRFWAAQVAEAVTEIERSLPAETLAAPMHKAFPETAEVEVQGGRGAPPPPPAPPSRQTAQPSRQTAQPSRQTAQPSRQTAQPPAVPSPGAATPLSPPTVPLPAAGQASPPTEELSRPPTGEPRLGSGAGLGSRPADPAAASSPALVSDPQTVPVADSSGTTQMESSSGRSRGPLLAVAGCAVVGLLLAAVMAWMLAGRIEGWVAQLRGEDSESSAVADAGEMTEQAGATSATGQGAEQVEPAAGPGEAASESEAGAGEDEIEGPRETTPPARGSEPAGSAEPAREPPSSSRPSTRADPPAARTQSEPPSRQPSAGAGVPSPTAQTSTPLTADATEEPAGEPAESEAEEESWPTPVPPDREMTVGMRLSFKVDPKEAYILFRAVGERRFTQVGQADEHDTSKRRRRAWDLPGPGTYEMILRSPGRRDYLLLLDASGGGESTIEARLARGQPGGASPR